jgi:hypothetical protein
MNHSTTDADFWDRWPRELQGMGELTAAIGLRATSFVMGNPLDSSSPGVAIMELPPGFVLPRHAHKAHRVEVVVAGSIDVGDRVLYPGDVMTANDEEAYGEHRAGPDGCTTVEIFSRLSGMNQTLWATAEGMTFVDLASPEAMTELEAVFGGSD